MTSASATWGRKRALPQPPSPEDRPSQPLLSALRARVEQGCPFELALRVVGVSAEVHEAWMARGLEIHQREPDRVYHDGGCRIAGSLEPEAEYARIATTVQAGAAAKLVEEVWAIATDRSGRRDRLPAIQMLLRGMGERSFDPRESSEVTVTAGAGRVDQATLDAMTPEERAALIEQSRAVRASLQAAEAAVEAARARAALPAKVEE